jgi:predicted nucleic acid-binding protein
VILVDTSVWIDHLRSGDPVLAGLLERSLVLAHAWVVGELALGRLRKPSEVIDLLGGLPQATVATSAEVLALIEHEELSGVGIGYVDAQLLAATRLTDGGQLWTGDGRLRAAAERLGCGFAPKSSPDLSA